MFLSCMHSYVYSVRASAAAVLLLCCWQSCIAENYDHLWGLWHIHSSWTCDRLVTCSGLSLPCCIQLQLEKAPASHDHQRVRRKMMDGWTQNLEKTKRYESFSHCELSLFYFPWFPARGSDLNCTESVLYLVCTLCQDMGCILFTEA